MSERISEFGASRRRVLGQGIAAAAGGGLWAGSPASASAQEETLGACASSHLIDGTITPFGAVRVVLGKGSGKEAKGVAVPVRVSAPEDMGELDVSGRVPTIRIGRAGGATIILTSKGIRLKKGAKEEPWRADSVGRLLSTINADSELRAALVALRTAIHAAYPQYVALSRHAAPGKIGAYYMKSNRSIEKFGTSKAAGQCDAVTVVENVSHDVTREVDVILTAAEQAERCMQSCEDQFGSPLRPLDPDFKPIEYGLCAAGCAVDGFADLFVGTAEIVETVTDQVVRQFFVCTPLGRPGFFPNPFDLSAVSGVAAPGGGTGAATAIDAGNVKDALGILKDLQDLSPVLACLIKGEWRITKLGDLHVEVNGVQEIPFGVTVCVDAACAETMSALSAAKGTIALIVKIVLLANASALEQAAIAAGVAAADVAGVVSACMLILGLMAILLAHLVIVAGQIAILDVAGLIDNGVCITHPSLPVVAAAVLNPVLGILALGNTPLVVTPR